MRRSTATPTAVRQPRGPCSGQVLVNSAHGGDLCSLGPSSLTRAVSALRGTPAVQFLFAEEGSGVPRWCGALSWLIAATFAVREVPAAALGILPFLTVCIPRARVWLTGEREHWGGMADLSAQLRHWLGRAEAWKNWDGRGGSLDGPCDALREADALAKTLWALNDLLRAAGLAETTKRCRPKSVPAWLSGMCLKDILHPVPPCHPPGAQTTQEYFDAFRPGRPSNKPLRQLLMHHAHRAPGAPSLLAKLLQTEAVLLSPAAEPLFRCLMHFMPSLTSSANISGPAAAAASQGAHPRRGMQHASPGELSGGNRRAGSHSDRWFELFGVGVSTTFRGVCVCA